jgi:hypothetical protein
MRKRQTEFELFINPENGGTIFIRNVTKLPPEYTAAHPRI